MNTNTLYLTSTFFWLKYFKKPIIKWNKKNGSKVKKSYFLNCHSKYQLVLCERCLSKQLWCPSEWIVSATVDAALLIHCDTCGKKVVFNIPVIGCEVLCGGVGGRAVKEHQRSPSKDCIWDDFHCVWPLVALKYTAQLKAACWQRWTWFKVVTVSLSAWHKHPPIN